MLLRLPVLAALLCSFASFAAAGAPSGAFRGLASVSKVDWTLKGPSSQRLENGDARPFYQALVEGKNLEAADRKNIEEFRLQGESLEARGYKPLQQPLTGQVFTSAQALVLYRKEDQKIPAGNGRPASVSVHLEFFYEQVFLKKGEVVTPATIAPRTRLHGSIYLECPAKSKEECPIAAIVVHESSIKWDYLPSFRMGGNSSAGGAGQD